MSDGDEHAMRVGEIMRHRVGGWLPSDQDALEEWLAGLSRRVEARAEPVELHPVIAEFQELIATDPVVRMYLAVRSRRVAAPPPRPCARPPPPARVRTGRAARHCPGWGRAPPRAARRCPRPPGGPP